MKTPFTQWTAENPIPSHIMVYARQARMQREEFAEFSKIGELFVVGTHHSKGIDLPVLLIDVPLVGLRIWVRDNFNNYAVSVESTHPLSYTQYAIDFSDVDSVYFEGFEEAGAPVYPVSTETKASFFYNGVALGDILWHLASQATMAQWEADDHKHKKAAALAWQRQLDANQDAQGFFLSFKTIEERDELYDALVQANFGGISLVKGDFLPDLIVKGITGNGALESIRRIAAEKNVKVKNDIQIQPMPVKKGDVQL